jgi:hypothetical protein
MQRTVTTRLGAAAVAAVFVVTSGITAMEAHQLVAHGVTAEAEIALQPVALAAPSEHGHHAHAHGSAASAPSAPDEHAGHADPSAGAGHSGHTDHGPTDDCTCVGPCASGAPPTLSDGTFAELSVGEIAPDRPLPMRARVIPQDPRTYLLPFPNPPPARV